MYGLNKPTAHTTLSPSISVTVLYFFAGSRPLLKRHTDMYLPPGCCCSRQHPSLTWLASTSMMFFPSLRGIARMGA